MTQRVTACLGLTATTHLNNAAIAPRCTHSSVRLEGNPGKKSKRQQRRMFLWWSGGWDGQESTCKRFITDMESWNILFHHVAFYVHPEMKTVYLRRKGMRDYVHNFWQLRLDCSVQRREIGEVRGIGEWSHFCKCLSWPGSPSGSDFFSHAVHM